MGYFIRVLTSLFAFFPPWFVAVIFSVIAIALIVLVIRIVGFVLDAIPFL